MRSAARESEACSLWAPIGQMLALLAFRSTAIALVWENNGMADGSRRGRAVVAVPVDAVDELERSGLASYLPAFRSPGVEALVTVGTDAAAMVTLMQAPDSVRAFAAWVRRRCSRSDESIELSAARGGVRVHLKVDGHVSVEEVAEFLAAALADHRSEP
jgi:hypothetical protein